MVQIVFERVGDIEVIYGIYITVPDEVWKLIYQKPETYRSMSYAMKQDMESPLVY